MKPRTFLSVALVVLSCAVLNAATGKSPGRIGVYLRLNQEAASSEKLRAAMKQIQATGIDFIIPLAKSSSVNWDSRVAPPELVSQPDYMARMVEAAHAEGLKVHPQFCVATEGGESKPNALLQKHPTWAYVYQGAPRGYIDPGNPEARAYEAALAAELVSKYKVDGLSLDYCRCPSQVGYTESGRAEFLKRYQVDLAKITSTNAPALDTEGGKPAARTPAGSARSHPVWPEWRKWRTQQINALAREIHDEVKKARPDVLLSSYVWGYHTYTNGSEVCQDWMTWIDEGLLDWINPSGYRYTDAAFLQAAQQNRAHVPRGFPFFITIGVHTSHGSLKDAAEIRKQMKMAQDCGADGLVFFTWEALRPFANEVAAEIKAYRPAR